MRRSVGDQAGGAGAAVGTSSVDTPATLVASGQRSPASRSVIRAERLVRTFRDAPLAREHLRCLRFMHDVEQHTTCYLRNLLNTKAHHDPEITASPLLWMAFSTATKHFLAVHMTFGAINEWTTQGGYARLIQQADHPVLTDLLRRIMKQEGRHIDYYRSQAQERLEASQGARRTTRFMIRKLWEPVGAQVMPLPETRHLVRTLFGGADGRVVADRIDRRVDSLPGLGGLRLMDSAGHLRRPRPGRLRRAAGQVVAVRQTPSATAASATYSATSGPTRGSNTDGTM